jgi:hypothetical protein
MSRDTDRLRRIDYWCCWIEEGAMRPMLPNPYEQPFFCPVCHFALTCLTTEYVMEIARSADTDGATASLVPLNER